MSNQHRIVRRSKITLLAQVNMLAFEQLPYDHALAIFHKCILFFNNCNYYTVYSLKQWAYVNSRPTCVILSKF